MTLITFGQVFIVCLLGAMSPGPSMAVVINNAIFKGRYSGILTSIGHGIGIAIYETFAVLGLGLIIENNLFIFNGLKISTTLALIGAIVAEFFGSPTVGMGFRISTSVGRLALDMVWAEIVVAAVVGSLFYGVIVIIEKGVTFWHPSQRG